MRLLAVSLLCTAACGRLGFDPVEIEPQDAATDGDCWARWKTGAPRFSPPAPIAELALPDKQGNPWLAADAKTLYFDSGTGDTEIFRTTRSGRGMPFGSLVQLTELTSPNEETSLALSADDLVGMISTSRPGAQGFDLSTIERADPNAPFATSAPSSIVVANLNSASNENDPFLSPDGLSLYYAQSTANGQILLVSSRQTRGSVFLVPQPLMGSGNFTLEADADLSPDELVIAFAAANVLPLQLFAAVRSQTTESFGTPFPLTDLAGPGHDADPAFSPDGCELFWISDRGGDRDLYHADVLGP